MIYRQQDKSLAQHLCEDILGVCALNHEELGQEDELPTCVLHQAVLLASKQLFVRTLHQKSW